MFLKNVSSFQQPWVYLLHFYFYSHVFACFLCISSASSKCLIMSARAMSTSVPSGEIPLAAASSRSRFLQLSTSSLYRSGTGRWVPFCYNSQTLLKTIQRFCNFFPYFSLFLWSIFMFSRFMNQSLSEKHNVMFISPSHLLTKWKRRGQ